MEPVAIRRLVIVLLGNALLRIAIGATGILVGLYLADLANAGENVGAALAGSLGAVSFGAELIGSIPLGVLADAFTPRTLMTAGALLGAGATQMFGMTAVTGIFFFSRAVEGLGAAASAPSLLAHLTDVTQGNPVLRARVMSYFELSLLAGLALGGVAGGELWVAFGTISFAAVAVVYLISGALLYAGGKGSRGHGVENAVVGLRRALRHPSLRRLAPIWVCANSLIGLWLGPTFSFLLTDRSYLEDNPRGAGQYLAGLFADEPDMVGYVLLGWAVTFSIGIVTWSFVLPKITLGRAMRISLVGMLGVCAGLYLLNHSGDAAQNVRWAITAVAGIGVMVESGFTPAALSLLANAVGDQPGRGGAMGIYSVLLSIGAIFGSLMAGWLASWLVVDGIIFGTLAVGVTALALVGTVKAD